MTSVFERPVKPSDCALAFGLPLTEAEVRHELGPSATKDWVKHFSAWYGNPVAEKLWSDYYVPEVVEPVRQLTDVAGRLGVTIYPACSLRELAEAAGRHPVLTLVSHWIEGVGIELDDGLHAAEHVAAVFPDGYGQVLDLMICQSILLCDEVKKRCPECICVCNAKPTRLRPKLFLYGQTLLALQQGRVSYPNAVLSTYREHIQRTGR